MQKLTPIISRLAKAVLFSSVLLPGLSQAVTFEAGKYKYNDQSIWPVHFYSLDIAKKFLSLENIVLTDANTPQATLGFGYSTDRTTPTVNCLVSGTTTYGGSGEGLVDVARNYNLYQVKQQLHLNTDVDVDIGIFSADMSADFVRELESDEYSEAFIYRTWIRLKNSIYNPPEQGEILNTRGKNLYNLGGDKFRYYCGDKYVGQLEWGGYLYVAVKFIFNSKSDKETFNSEMSTSFGDVFEMDAKLSSAVSKISKNGAIRIQAYQLGGDPTKLGKILGGGGGEAPVVYCSFDDLGKCKQMLDNVIKYATNSSDDNFPTQIKIGGPEIPVSAAQTNLDLNDYEDLGYPILSPSKVTPEIKASRHDLATALESIKTTEDRANFLMGRFSYAPDYVTKLQDVVSILQQNETAIKNAGTLCYTDFDNCKTNAEKVLHDLKPINQNLLQQPYEQIVTLSVNGSVGYHKIGSLPFPPEYEWNITQPSVSYNLISGELQQTNYNSISTNGAKIPNLPCQNTSTSLLGASYSFDKNEGWKVILPIYTCKARYLGKGVPAIQQHPYCSSGYNIVFGGLGQGEVQQVDTGDMSIYWNDAYSLTYRFMHYYE
jgi:hypothetical protein